MFTIRYLPILGLTGCLLLFAGCKDANQFKAPPPPPVSVAKPTQMNVANYDTFTGRLKAIQTLTVRARVKGFLTDIYFKDASFVSKGQRLFQIDPRQYAAEVESTQAQLAQAKAQAAEMQAKFVRVKDAFDNNAASDFELIEARAQRDQADAAVLLAESQLADANLNLGYTNIHAEISGQINRSMVDAGNLVGDGEATVLCTIVAKDPIYVYFNIDERILLETLKKHPIDPNTGRQKGNAKPVVLKLSDGTYYRWYGQIDYINNQVDPSTGTVTVRAIVPNPNYELYSGMFTRVEVPKNYNDAILVPTVALQRDMVGWFLLTVDKDNKAQRTDVTVGPIHGNMQVITSGLNMDQQVIINGLQRARPGAPVQPKQVQMDIKMPPTPQVYQSTQPANLPLTVHHVSDNPQPATRPTTIQPTTQRSTGHVQ